MAISLTWKARFAQARNPGNHETLLGRARLPPRPDGRGGVPDLSLNVFMGLESIDNLLKHFQNIEKWMRKEKIQ